MIKGLTKEHVEAFLANALPCFIMSFCMLGFMVVAYFETDETLSAGFLACGSMSFVYTLFGYEAYCSAYKDKKSPSPFYAVVYTLFFPMFYLPYGLKMLITYIKSAISR